MRICKQLTDTLPSSICPGTSSIALVTTDDPHECIVGMYLADATVFLSVAMSLAVFDIRKPLADGVEVQPNVDFTSGVIRCVVCLCMCRRFAHHLALSHPPPFECSIKPRSEKAEALILTTKADPEAGGRVQVEVV